MRWYVPLLVSPWAPLVPPHPHSAVHHPPTAAWPQVTRDSTSDAKQGIAIQEQGGEGAGLASLVFGVDLKVQGAAGRPISDEELDVITSSDRQPGDLERFRVSAGRRQPRQTDPGSEAMRLTGLDVCTGVEAQCRCVRGGEGDAGSEGAGGEPVALAMICSSLLPLDTPDPYFSVVAMCLQGTVVHANKPSGGASSSADDTRVGSSSSSGKKRARQQRLQESVHVPGVGAMSVLKVNRWVAARAPDCPAACLSRTHARCVCLTRAAWRPLSRLARSHETSRRSRATCTRTGASSAGTAGTSGAAVRRPGHRLPSRRMLVAVSPYS